CGGCSLRSGSRALCFFQAEDGIRGRNVTGVQTCALPIWIAPWKLPVRGRVYVDGPVDLADEGLVPAPLEEATLITCIPRDPTLHRLVDLRPGTAEPEDLPIADPAIVYWDLVHTTDTDSGEAAARLA